MLDDPAGFTNGEAPPERTLIDILDETLRRHPTTDAVELTGVRDDAVPHRSLSMEH